MSTTSPDIKELLARLERIKRLTEELTRAQQASAAQRDVVERLGVELDGARRALRPQLQSR